jgi:hypothetical protein
METIAKAWRSRMTHVVLGASANSRTVEPASKAMLDCSSNPSLQRMTTGRSPARCRWTPLRCARGFACESLQSRQPESV